MSKLQYLCNRTDIFEGSKHNSEELSIVKTPGRDHTDSYQEKFDISQYSS
jgi:hypothetical protein